MAICQWRFTHIVDINIENKLKDLYVIVGNDIDNGDTKEGLIKIFEYISYSNKYFDSEKPWILFKEDKIKCEEILYNCCNIIYNINNLLKPYLVDCTKIVEDYLTSYINDWNYHRLDKVNISNNIEPLFIRYEVK